MLRQYGRYQGDIQNFELWDWFTPQRVNGHYFTAVCEWLPDVPKEGQGGWLSVCAVCQNFRCLKIDIQKQTWQCSKCDRKGTFKKPEEEKREPMKKKKSKKSKSKELPAESEKEGMKTQKQYLDDYTKKSSVKKKVNWNDYHKESEYEYKDGKDNVLWQKRKYRHKNGKDKICLCGHYEGKKWKVGIPKGTEKPLYRLPEFLASQDKTRFICEGEKDTDNLRTFGHTAVCSPFGAKYWNEEWSQFFIAKEAILVPDNDEAGQAFEQKVGENLIKVTKVHVARIAKKYKDFSEWKAVKGNNEEAFKKLKFEKWKPKGNLVLRGSKNREKKQKEFMPSFYAKKILAKYKVIYDKHKRLWFYDQEEGIWKDSFEILCRSILRKGLLASFDSQVHENEVIFALRDLSYQENIPEEPASHLIPFKNKIYDLKKDKLYDFKPGYFFINKLGVNYNPKNKDYPNIERLFEQIVGKREIITLKEIIAYTMFRDYPYPKAFMLYGNGANGKSTYCQVVRKVIGNENVSSVSLNTLLYNTFGTSELYGKLINISPEMSYNVLKKTDVIKSLSGKDLMRGEKKFKDAFHFVNYAKLIFIGNEIPYSTDKSFAFYRRMFLVEFPKRFEIRIKADPFIIDRIPEEEFEALAYESINTLKELGKNLFTFTRHKKTDKIMEEYERLSDPLGTFLKEKTEDDSKSDIPVKNFNSEFKDFQSKNGLREWTDLGISKVMTQKGYIKKTLRIATSIKGEYRFYKAYLELSWKV
ncbi:hypothetical protein ES707_16955 [subsurface metagenome]